MPATVEPDAAADLERVRRLARLMDAEFELAGIKFGWLTRMRMLGNTATDFGIGLIPFVGDIVDVGFKANLKNLKLLEKALEKKGR